MLLIKNNSIYKFIIKNLLQYIIFIVIIVFDIIIFLYAYRYYNQPVIIDNYIRVSGYSWSLVRDRFVLIDKNYYYCDENAEIVKNKIINWENQDYYLDKEGILITNQKNYDIGGILYDIDKNGVITKKENIDY